jgi:hypothetical protein
MTKPHGLRSVPEYEQQAFDPETGEIIENLCPRCADTAAQLDGAEKEIRAWRARYASLLKDKKEEAEHSQFWPIGIALFQEWKIATNHWRSAWTADRFWLCQPFLEREKFTACRYAVWGIAAHPNRKEITPDYFEVYDSFELVFRNQDTFERYANRGAAVFGRELPIPAGLEVPDWLRIPRYGRLSPLYDSASEEEDRNTPATGSQRAGPPGQDLGDSP